MLWRRPRVLVQAIRWLQSHACSSHETTGDVLHRLPTSRWCTRLSHRGLLRVSGADARTLLQGLVTADMFSEHRTARFAMMLNAQGRVLYEIILYQRKNGGYLLECDASAREEIMKHLQRYILHSKVEVEPEALQVWSLYPGVPEAGGPLPQPGGVEALDSDPRVRELGCRLVSTPVFNVQEMWPDIQEQVLVCYHKHRYKEGVAEGVEEVAKGNCFPLEYNLDYMNGVSFDKGCYLGQELTARTHYSGVVRKRILPFELSGSSDLPPGTSIVNSGGKRVGKVVCCCGDVGLALMRVKEMTQALTSLNSDGRSVQIHVHFPTWFPA